MKYSSILAIAVILMFGVSITAFATEISPDPSTSSGGQSTTGDGAQSTTGSGGQPTTGGGGRSTVNPNATPQNNFNVILNSPVNMSIEQIFQAILDIIMVFAVPIIVFFIIWAGFLYVTAAGKPDQIEKANKALLYAIIGGLLVLGANVLLVVITNTLQVFTN